MERRGSKTRVRTNKFAPPHLTNPPPRAPAPQAPPTTAPSSAPSPAESPAINSRGPVILVDPRDRRREPSSGRSLYTDHGRSPTPRTPPPGRRPYNRRAVCATRCVFPVSEYVGWRID